MLVIDGYDTRSPEEEQRLPYERTIFIGDIHGCAAEFEETLDAVVFRGGRDRLLLTGDAFTRGPDPMRVWELIGETRADMVLGNHDDRQLRQLREHAAGNEPRFKHDNQQQTFTKLAAVAAPLLAWLEQRPLYIEAEGFVLVHAGIHPEKGLSGTTRDEFLTIRTWPPADGIDGRRWHDVITPMRDRISALSAMGSSPRILIWPASGLMKPSHISTVVVFPAPLGPSSANTSAVRTSRSSSDTATVDPYRLLTPRSSRGAADERARGEPTTPGVTETQRRRRIFRPVALGPGELGAKVAVDR